ncbi:MAG TPA: DUF1559 domain-containing protein [Candidatus Hydrogenedentes bacterium]|nr:DUF1559 domain-containing protein [Candidatus Hydrogenedentota bacterium]HRZ82240.1 DUF1559 domain-containing protein [Candidatus Hydrogenedentota bacterium]
MRQRGLTTLELCAVLTLITILALILLPIFGSSPAARRSPCQNNLKQWGLVMKMYSNEHEGAFPPMQVLRRRPDNTFDLQMAAGPSVRSVYPEYLTDVTICVCPNSPLAEEHAKRIQEEGLAQSPRLVASGYQYLGWALDNLKPCAPASAFPHLAALSDIGTVPDGNTLVPVQMGALLDAVLDPAHLAAKDALAVAADVDRDADLSSTAFPTSGNRGEANIYRLHEGIERLLITDSNNPGASAMAQSTLWVMSDRMTAGSDGVRLNHVPPEKTRFQKVFGGCARSNSPPFFGGCNVLFLDGHVEFMRYIPVPGLDTMAPEQAEEALQGANEPVLVPVAAVIGALGGI